jgi:hypothetical protein
VILDWVGLLVFDGSSWGGWLDKSILVKFECAPGSLVFRVRRQHRALGGASPPGVTRLSSTRSTSCSAWRSWSISRSDCTAPRPRLHSFRDFRRADLLARLPLPQARVLGILRLIGSAAAAPLPGTQYRQASLLKAGCGKCPVDAVWTLLLIGVLVLEIGVSSW